MAQIIRSKNRKGRSAQIVVYDLQGTPLAKEFIEKMEERILGFLEEHPAGKSVAVTVNVE
jgi:hypothetical protein